MSKLTCPHCGEKGVTLLRKMCLGPARPTACRSCAKRVGVPYGSMVAFVPFLLAVIFAGVTDSVLLKSLLWLGGFGAMSVLFLRWVPLVPR